MLEALLLESLFEVLCVKFDLKALDSAFLLIRQFSLFSCEEEGFFGLNS